MSVRSLNWLKFGGLVALAFALGLLFAGLLDLPRSGAAQQLAQSAGTTITPVPAPSIPQARPLADLSGAFAAVADAIVPSVVYIRSGRTEQQTRRNIPPGFERFFGPDRNQGPRYQQGSGSGFVVSADGYILTNNHVVAGAEHVTVRLHDRREFSARVVGTDPTTDIAVLRIDAQNLKPASLGNSDDQKIGEWVLAVGNPLHEGLTFTVTSGIISAKGRALPELRDQNDPRANLNISDFIQTDAAINPGNSGGPLVNVRGEVIGINSAIASATGFYSGYGFAIPINLARNVMRQLITDGRVHRAAIGVSIQEASLLDAEYVGLDGVRGVLVQSFGENSPARAAGLEVGDVIIAVNGKRVDRVGQLQQEIGFRKPGESVRVDVARKGGVRKAFDVRLVELDAAAQAAAADDPAAEQPGRTGNAAAGSPQPLLGARVQPVTSTIAEQLGVPAGTAGLLIADVTPAGPAWDAGLVEPSQAAADIIQRVEGRPVRTEAELTSALRAAGAGSIVTLEMLRVTREGPVNYIERVRLAPR